MPKTKTLKPLTEKQKLNLILKIKRDDGKAAAKLARNYLSLIRTTIKRRLATLPTWQRLAVLKFQRKDRSTGEYINATDFLSQQGLIGLLLAARHFNAKSGVYFDTFALDWIRMRIGTGVEHAILMGRSGLIKSS